MTPTLKQVRTSIFAGIFALLATSPAAKAIEITGASLPPNTVLQIDTGSVDFQVDVRGTAADTPNPVTYPYIVYINGRDIYGNQVYLEAASGTVTVRGEIPNPNGEGTLQPTTDRILGKYTIPNDGTLHNITSGYRLYVEIYQPGSAPTDVTQLNTNLAAPRQTSGKLDIDVLPDLAIGVPGTTYLAGRYRGSDIIQFNNTWQNDSVGEGGRQSRPLRSNGDDRYVVDLRLTTNPEFGDAKNDDFLLSRLLFAGDTPFVPNDRSILRMVTVDGTPGPVEVYGLVNNDQAPVAGTGRNYTPQPDDRFLDIGESVTVSLEQLIPENYSGAYFVAVRATMTDEREDAATNNNLFVSNEKNKIEILETDSPTTEPSSVISSDNGAFIKNGDAASDYSSVNETGDLITFASRARDLLVPPNLASICVLSLGPTGDLSDPTNYPVQNELGTVNYADIEPYLTVGQQIFVKYRQTRELVLASRNAGGSEANADSFNPMISADGRYVAFDSVATDILPKLVTGSRSKIYVFDTQKLAATIVSKNSSLELANGDSFNPALSQSGRFVVFESMARNLDPARPVAATNPNQQIYLHDRDSDLDGLFDESEAGATKTSLISVNNAGEVANGWCANPVVNLLDTTANFTGSITGDTLNVTSVSVGRIEVGMKLSGVGVAPGTMITGFGSGTGNTGMYTVSNSQTVSPGVLSAEFPFMYVAFTSYAGNMPGGTGYAMVYRAKVDTSTGAVEVEPASVNDSGASPQAVGVDPFGAFIQPFADEATINGDGSQVAYTSAANNLVATLDGTYVPTFPNNDPANPSAPVDPNVVPDGDYNRVPDVFVRNFLIPTTTPNNGSVVRVSVSQPRVATGTITFATPFFRPSLPPGGPGTPPGNIPTAQPLPGDSISLGDGGASVTLIFGTDVAIGATVFETRDNLVQAINTSGLNIIAYASNPPSADVPGTGYVPSIYLRGRLPSVGDFANQAIVTDSLALAVVGMQGGGTQADEEALTSQGVAFGSVQPSIDRSGRFVAFRSNAYNLDVHVETPENTYPRIPPMPTGEPLVSTGELIRPLVFPTSNIYLHDRQADSDPASGFDALLNSTTDRVSVSKFGYKTYIDGSEQSGEDASTSANNSRPFISADGRFVSFSSDSIGEGGLVFGPNNLTPLDNQNTRDVFVHDRRSVGPNPPAPNTRPLVALKSPAVGLRVVPGTTIPISATALAVNGKTISSVQFFVNGVAVGPALTAEPYSASYTLANPGEYVVRVVATDSRGITGSDTVTIIAGQPLVGSAPLVAVTQPASQVSNYVVGSDLVFNATAEDSGSGALATSTVASGEVTSVLVDPAARGSGYSPNTKVFFEGGGGSGASGRVTVDANGSITSVIISNPGSGYTLAPAVYFSEIETLTFSVGGQLLAGERGFDGNWFVPFRPSQTGSFSISAFAVDVDGNFGISSVGTIVFWGIGDTFPSVEIIENNAGLPKVAGGNYPLRAKLTFQPPTFVYDTANSSVLFYGDGVYLGLGTLQADGTYLLNWSVPETPRTYEKIYAYLSAPNFFVFPDDGNEDGGAPTLYASVVVRSKNSLGPLTFQKGILPSVSLIKPADNAQISAGVATLLEATASVTAGQGTIAQVEFYQNGVLIGPADNAAPYQIDFTPPSPGQYTLTALAYSTAGVINESAPIVVNAVSGIAPDVSITTPSDGDEVTPGLPVTVTVDASDADGAVTSVELIVNGVVVGTSNQAPFIFTDGGLFVTGTNTTFTPTSEGVYKIVARARDNLGNVTDSDPVTVIGKTATPVGRPPIVQVTQPVGEVYYVSGSSFFLNARATDTPPGQVDPDSVEFTVNGIPVTGLIGRIGNTYGVRYTPENLFGIDSIKAEATDNDGNTTISSANYTVLSVPFARMPEVEMLPLAPGSPTDAGGVVQLRAEAIIPPPFGVPFDAENDQSRVEFYADGVYIGAGTPQADGSYLLNWETPETPASFTVQARVVSRNWTTNTGEGNVNSFFASVISEEPLIVNTIQGAVPTISLTAPADGVEAPVNVPLTIRADASVTGGTVAEVQFYVDGVLVSSGTVDPTTGVIQPDPANPNPDTAFPYQFTYTPTSAGLRTIQAIAVASNGIRSISAAVQLNVVSGAAPIARITSPPDGTELPYGSTVNVTYNSSDADGSVQKIELLRNGVVVRTLEAPATPLIGNGLISDTPPSFGSYTYLIRATDNLGNVSSVTADNQVVVTIKSNATSTLPVVSILQQSIADRVYVSGSRFFLNGQAKAQAGATIQTNSFKFSLNSREYAGAPSGLDFGAGEVFTALVNADDLAGPDGNANTLSALAVDSNDQTGVSPATAVYTGLSQKPLPSITALDPIAGSSSGAGGYVTLRAAAVFPASTPDQRRVEFYANGVYLGETTATPVPDPQNPNSLVYSFSWQTPSDPGSFVIQARAVALNFSRSTDVGSIVNPDIVDFYGSSVSLNSVALNTIPGTPPVVAITQPTNGSDVRAGVAFNIQATASVPVSDVTAPLPGAWAIATNNSVVPPRPYRVGDFVDAGTTIGTVTFPSLPALPVTATGTIRSIIPNGNVTTGQVVATTGGGNIQRVDFYANGVLVGTDQVAPYTASFTPPSPGPYTLVAEAYTTDGLLGVSAPISVNSRLSEPPSVSIVSPPTGSTLSVNQPVTLIAQASDPDGSVVSVNFEVNGSPVAGSLSAFGAWTGTFTPTSGGTYTVVAIATDNSGNQTTSSPASVYTVSSTSNLTVDVTAPTEGQSFTLGTPVLLSATASTSPGTVTGLQFYVNYQPVGPLLTTAPYFFAYTPPSVGPYTVFAVATDSNGISKSSTALRNFTVKDAPATGVPTIFLSAPSNAFLVSGARVYLNFTVATPQPDSIPASNVKIYIDGVPQTGVTKIGLAGDTFAVPWTVGTRSSYSIFATAQDSAGTTAFSGVTTIQTVAPGTSPPLVEILPYETFYPQLAVGAPVKLRARANFRNNTAPQFLEFYANGVLLGPGVPGTASGGYTSYSLDWVPTVASSAVTFTARAVGSNAKVGTTVIDYFASAISSNSVNPPVTNIPILDVPDLTTGKQLNGQFVLWMFNQLLYRDPTYPEYFENLQLLGGNENGNASASVKADVVMNLMGYNTATLLFNQGTEYAQTSAIAFAPFGRLSLEPTSAGIINFISLNESDPSPLPLPGTYGGLTGAPWRATYGMARAMQSAIFDTPVFNQLYQGVSGLNGTPFVLWMTGSTTAPVTPAVMFPGRLTGGDSRVALANMIDDTPTLVSPDAANILQGAGAAFQSEYIAAALNSGLASNDPGNTEKTFQRRLQSASLDFQLGRNLQPDGSWTTDVTWNFNGAQLYSKEVVAGILVRRGYATAAAAPASPAAMSQAISFKLPSNLKVGRTYRLSARASSGMTPVTFALESSSASRATLSGTTLTVTQPGAITVTASQAGGTKMPSAKAARRGAPPVVYGPASANKEAIAR